MEPGKARLPIARDCNQYLRPYHRHDHTIATFAANSTGTGGNSITTAISGGIGAFATAHFTGGSALVSVGGPAVAGDTVTVGTQTYTFVNAINANSAANSVLVGAGTGAASETASLSNLAAAVNGATGAGSIYGLGTTANASATASLVANPNSGPVNQILFTALTGGAGTSAAGTGNFIASTSPAVTIPSRRRYSAEAAQARTICSPARTRPRPWPRSILPSLWSLSFAARLALPLTACSRLRRSSTTRPRI